MPLRRTAVAALVLAVTGAMAPATTGAQAAPSSDHQLIVKQLPRPERPRAAEGGDFDPHAVLVRFKPGVSKSTTDRAITRHNARTVSAVRGTGYVKVSTAGSATELMAALRKDPAVASVSLDHKRRATAIPNDPAYTSGSQNYLNTVRLPQAWDRTKGSTSQVIAVLDTGVNTAHEDLTGRTVTGYNAVFSGEPPADYNGHGTMVAGIAAANTNNGKGIAGAAWTAKIMPVKVLNYDGTGSDSDIAEGITWAADHGAKVINMSLGGPRDGAALHDAIRYANGKGVVVVAAAGNDGGGRAQYPAAYPEVISVGATDASGRLTDFSSHGDWIDVAAPGAAIVSTGLAQDYYVGDGTSFSAPLVSGVVALVRAVSPTMTTAQVLGRLRGTARDAGPRGIDPYYGAGILDAYHAVGGSWAAEFPQPSLGANEPNDVPARATTLGVSTPGTIGIEGDVDWYRYDVSTRKPLTFTVTPPAYDSTRAQNVDPVLAVYDSDLRPVGEADINGPGAAEKITATLAAGTHYVAVRNYNGALDTRSYTVTVAGAPTPVFAPAQVIPTNSALRSVVVGDVTGDGRADVVASTAEAIRPEDAHKLLVFAQRPDGSLAPPVRYATAMGIYIDLEGTVFPGLALLDADGDGDRDVALATQERVQLFRQNDAGTLDAPSFLPGTYFARTLVAADMDGDSDQDLVVSCGSDAGTKLLTQQADGTFTPSDIGFYTDGEIEVGEVSGDGHMDVIGTSGQHLWVNHGPDWNLARGLPTGSDLLAVAGEVADVTGDGRLDLVASVGGAVPNAYLAVYPQTSSDGLDLPPVINPVPASPEPVEAADVNGDGRADVVTAHGGATTLSVLLQQADGSLSTPVTSAVPYASHYNVQGLGLGDINGDNRVDAVLANRSGGLVVLRNGAVPGTAGEQLWVRDVAPADFATDVPVTVKPTVTFARDVDPATVSSSTVRLLNGRTGSVVAATVGVSGSTVTLTPTGALLDNTPYRIVVSGLKDRTGAAQTEPFTTTFRTVDLAPPAVGSLKATGAYRAATLTWTLPAITDLDQVIVRMNAGTTAPASPTAGTAVYAGTGTSATASGLVVGTTYTFGVWVRDRSGRYSPAATVRLVGTGVTIGSNVSTVTYGGAVTVTGQLRRTDTGAAIAGQVVQLYGRVKGSTSAFALLGTATTSSTGALTFSHKPAKNFEYQWVYRGSTAFTGAASLLRPVNVLTAVTATLSKTSFPLGGSVTLSGTVAPNHAGQTVYLQRLVSGSWKNITSRTLSSTSAYSFTIKPTARGTYYYRVYKPADADHTASASPSRSFKVT